MAKLGDMPYDERYYSKDRQGTPELPAGTYHAVIDKVYPCLSKSPFSKDERQIAIEFKVTDGDHKGVYHTHYLITSDNPKMAYQTRKAVSFLRNIMLATGVTDIRNDLKNLKARAIKITIEKPADFTTQVEGGGEETHSHRSRCTFVETIDPRQQHQYTDQLDLEQPIEEAKAS